MLIGELMDIINVHYNEIGIKGNNFTYFENMLIDNINKMLKRANINNVKIIKKHKHLLLETDKINETKEILKNVFGVRYFRIGERIPRDINLLKEKTLEFFKSFGTKKTFKIIVNRVDKSYKLSSMEIAQELGKTVCDNCDVQSDLENPEFIFHIDLLDDSFIVCYDRIEGLGGLPVGATGKVICLISGGIDSPVAVLLMMKRGCTPILYSVNCKSDKDFNIVKDLKDKLEKYSPESIELITENSDDFNKIVIKIAERNREPYNCLAFKYFLLQRAELLATEKGALGLVTGDNLGQVASQTLENLNAQRTDLHLPVYSPLIGFDKEDIIAISKKFDFYETSIKKKEDYFFLPRKPITKAKTKEFQKITNIVNEFIKKKNIN